MATAAPPVNPLPAPLYSFDLASPTVGNGIVNADDVLALNDPFPVAAISGTALGLGASDDELDGLSAANAAVLDSFTFVLRFSVSRDTVGTAPPDPGLVNLGLPYNVLDQAARGHQAGDEFMSTLLFSRSSASQSGDGNNSQSRNNYNEGGTDFSAQPQTSSQTVVVNQPQDNVDALADTSAAVELYFSASAASPSLSSLPGSASASGAHVFFYNLVQTTLFASHADLGLLQADDVDAMVVFDTNLDGLFNGTDQVLFSLAPGSPSLATIPGASAQGAAADVFSVEPGEAPRLFASASSLGLGASGDDIDGLEILLCETALSCIADHAIRRMPGDFDHDGDVDSDDLQSFNGCFGGEGVPYGLGCEPGDFDQDSDVDCSDWSSFQSAWTAEESPSAPAECAAGIPTVSHYGLALIALLIAFAGSRILTQRQQGTS